MSGLELPPSEMNTLQQLRNPTDHFQEPDVDELFSVPWRLNPTAIGISSTFDVGRERCFAESTAHDIHAQRGFSLTPAPACSAALHHLASPPHPQTPPQRTCSLCQNRNKKCTTARADPKAASRQGSERTQAFETDVECRHAYCPALRIRSDYIVIQSPKRTGKSPITRCNTKTYPPANAILRMRFSVHRVVHKASSQKNQRSKDSQIGASDHSPSSWTDRKLCRLCHTKLLHRPLTAKGIPRMAAEIRLRIGWMDGPLRKRGLQWHSWEPKVQYPCSVQIGEATRHVSKHWIANLGARWMYSIPTGRRVAPTASSKTKRTNAKTP